MLVFVKCPLHMSGQETLLFVSQQYKIKLKESYRLGHVSWLFLIFSLKLPPAHSDSPSSPTSAINSLSVGVIVSSSSNAKSVVFSYHSS